jgi:adenylate cyclase
MLNQGGGRSAQPQAPLLTPRRGEAPPQAPTWRTYLGIIGLLLLLVVGLVGGIIWYNAKQLSDLMVADAERKMDQTGDKVTERIRLLFDPIYAIVGLSAHVHELTAPIDPEKAQTGAYQGLFLMLRGLRIYPQIMSIFVGFENGDFFMATHLAGEDAVKRHAALGAPAEAVFAAEIIVAGADGKRLVRWFFLDDDGNVIASRQATAAEFDPTKRPWYEAARKSENVEHTDLYVFAASGEPGFTVSRRFGTPVRGVFGADLAATDIVHFLRDQRVTPSSAAFIFTRAGEAIAVPDEARMRAIIKSFNSELMIPPPKIADLGDPLLMEVSAQYKPGGTQYYDVKGRRYIGKVIEIPQRYGRDQLLAVMVPLDEIEKPIIKMRNDALFRSIIILLLVLPLYATLVIGLIDRRLGRRASGRRRFVGEDEQEIA